MYLCSYQVNLHLNHVYMSDFEYKRIYEYYYDDFKFEDNKIKIKIKKIMILILKYYQAIGKRRI